MTEAQLRKLLESGECLTVDFKLTCKAFTADEKHIGPKAELAKDICAMANNGFVASYLIIGVANDASTFQPTTSLKLTADNLQNFCTTAITPPPRVSVHKVDWLGNELTVIQVGPNPKYAYSIARDFIDYKSNTCIRRNEVWIRRNATTDLARPEEIAELLKGKPIRKNPSTENNVEFDKLPRDQRSQVVLSALEEVLSKFGGQLRQIEKNLLYAVIPIDDVQYVWNVSYSDYLPEKGNTHARVLRYWWRYEHGQLLITEPRSTKGLLQYTAKLHFKQPWGWFSCIDNFERYKHNPYGPSSAAALVPDAADPISYFVYHLHGIGDSDALLGSFTELHGFLRSSAPYSDQVKLARANLNKQLRYWLEAGWGTEVTRSYIRKKPEELTLRKGEYYEPVSGRVLRDIKPKPLITYAKNMLALCGELENPVSSG